MSELGPERVLVTGGSGFIGTNLVQRLLELGVEVASIDVAAPRRADHVPVHHRVDLCDAAAVRTAFERFQPQVVVHLGARTDLDGATLRDYAANVDGVRSVIDAAAAVGAGRVLFGSSQLVCTPGHRPVDELDYSPPNPYGESKVLGEQLVREHAGDRFAWVLIRPTSIWGPWWGPLYSAFFRAVRAGRYVHPRGVHVRKSFGFVDNAVDRLVALAQLPAERIHARMFYLSDDEPYVIRDWAEEIAAAFGTRPIREVPLWMLRTAAAVGDGARRLGVTNPPISSYRLRNMCTDTVFDMEPLIDLCGPQRLERVDGVRRTVAWMQRADEGSGAP